MAPEVHKQLKDLSMAKCIPVSTNTVQVNELAGHDPSEVDQAFNDHMHRSDNRLIVTHHSVPLWSLEAKIVGTGWSILGVLDSGSEIVAMPKQVWEDLGLPAWSDHVMTMSNTNTSTESTLSVVENLRLDFSASEICLQVQVVPRANLTYCSDDPSIVYLALLLQTFWTALRQSHFVIPTRERHTSYPLELGPKDVHIAGMDYSVLVTSLSLKWVFRH